MAHSKSAIKRIRQNERKRLTNKARSSATKTQIKKFLTAVAEGEHGKAEAEYRLAVSAIDKAIRAGLYHGNKAARMKSRLAARLAGVGASS